MIVKKFHQFVVLEKGPVNTAIVDFLKGDVYQIGNELIAKFLQGEHEGIEKFIQKLEDEELIFEVEETGWIPAISFEDKEEESFQLEVEEGADLEFIYEKFRVIKVTGVIYSGKELPQHLPGFPGYTLDDEGFEACLELSKVDGNFRKIDENVYRYNKNYNSCWGKRISITKKGEIKPCLHSSIIIGHIEKDDVQEVVEKAKEYWKLTKDKVEKCKDCELRYVCFDCRVIATEEKESLSAANPYCTYDPYKGTWIDGV